MASTCHWSNSTKLPVVTRMAPPRPAPARKASSSGCFAAKPVSNLDGGGSKGPVMTMFGGSARGASKPQKLLTSTTAPRRMCLCTAPNQSPKWCMFAQAAKASMLPLDRPTWRPRNDRCVVESSMPQSDTKEDNGFGHVMTNGKPIAWATSMPASAPKPATTTSGRLPPKASDSASSMGAW